jgi:hypothetical protein
MKPRVSDNLRDRNTAAIGSFAERREEDDGEPAAISRSEQRRRSEPVRRGAQPRSAVSAIARSRSSAPAGAVNCSPTGMPARSPPDRHRNSTQPEIINGDRVADDAAVTRR